MDNAEIRVLHVLDILSPASGVACVVMNCIKGLPHVLQDVVVYGQCDSDMEAQIRACGGVVYKLPDITKSFGQHFGIEFSKLLQTQKYAIVHGHLINSAFIYLRLAKAASVPHRIIHSHSAVSADVFYKKIRNNLLAKLIPFYATDYIAVSESAAANAFGKKAATTNIIFNGIDSDRFRFNPELRKEVRHELGLSDDTLCVGHVARLVALKNQDFLLDVFHKISQMENSVLVIAGEGSMAQSLEAKVRELDLSECVKFLGKRNDSQRLYQAFDVFLLPSLSEGFGLAALEAQCAGLPCIVSNQVPQAIACGDNIQFLPLGNVMAWADTAVNMSKSLRTDGFTGVTAAKLDVHTMCNEILKVYESLVVRDS